MTLSIKSRNMSVCHTKGQKYDFLPCHKSRNMNTCHVRCPYMANYEFKGIETCYKSRDMTIYYIPCQKSRNMITSNVISIET